MAVVSQQQQTRKGGLSELAKSEERTAMWLLAPTIILLILIAIYPLLRVFYLSTTNKRFASSQPVEFVGFQNFRNLLSLTIRGLPVKVDADGQPVVEDGVRQYESAVSVLP